MTSHSVEQARQFSQRIIGIRQGRIVRDAAADTWQPADFAVVYGGAAHES